MTIPFSHWKLKINCGSVALWSDLVVPWSEFGAFWENWSKNDPIYKSEKIINHKFHQNFGAYAVSCLLFYSNRLYFLGWPHEKGCSWHFWRGARSQQSNRTLKSCFLSCLSKCHITVQYSTTQYTQELVPARYHRTITPCSWCNSKQRVKGQENLTNHKIKF